MYYYKYIAWGLVVGYLLFEITYINSFEEANSAKKQDDIIYVVGKRVREYTF